MKRNLFIDQLRALSIFLIVYGHNDYESLFSEFSSSFRLPMFFIVSGFIGKSKNEMSLLFCLKKYAYRLIIPYLITAILLFLFWLFFSRHFGASAEKDYSILKNLIGIVYAQGGPEYMNWGIPLWYLPALFCVMMLDWGISKLKEGIPQYISVTLIIILGYTLSTNLSYALPWSLDIAMIVYVFYFIGRELKKHNLIELISKKTWLFIFIPFALNIIGSIVNESVAFYYREIGFLPLTYLNGFLGFLWLFSLIMKIPPFKPIVWIGQNTLPILTFHLLAMTLIKGILIFLFDYSITFNFLNSMLFALLQILTLAPVIIFLNKYFPLITGKDVKKNYSLNHDNL